MFLHNQPHCTMTTTVNTSQNRAFERMDMFIAIACMAVSGASAIGVALTLALWESPGAIFVLCPLGGLAQCLLWNMYRNHRIVDRDIWKWSIQNGLRHLNTTYKELKWYFSELSGTGWKGLVARVILTFILMVKAIIPLIVYSILILLAGSMFAVFIRTAISALGD